MITYRRLGRNGRFGNQLFQIASTIGIAASIGREAIFPPWRNYDHSEHEKMCSSSIGKFFVNDLATMNEWLENKSRKWPVISIPFGADIRPRQLPRNMPFVLDGFLQSEKYFINAESFIREQFKTSEYHKAPIINKSYCSIHVRRGDYIGLNVYNELSKKYYTDAVNMMIDRGFRKFFVFSDDIKTTRELFTAWKIGDEYPFCEIFYSDNIPFDYFECREFHEAYLNDFVTMKSYGGHIISNSTFSWWTAWLSDSDCVIAPRNWVLPHMKSDQPDQDINSERWIVIDES